MFKVVPSDAVVEQVDRALGATSDRDRSLRDTCLPALASALRARVPGAAIVRVPRDPDRVERALLELASHVGPDCLQDVAGHLRHEPGHLSATLATLGKQWGDRFLVVDGLDALRVSGDDEYDAGYAQADRYAEAHTWFTTHARLTTNDLQPRDSRDEAPAVLQNGRCYPRPDLWQQFAPDAGVYSAALAWLALRGDPESSISFPAWKLHERVVDALPDEALECLWLLGLHGRPLADDLLAQIDPNGGRHLLDDLGLAGQSTSGWTVDRYWAQWCSSEASGDERAEGYRRRLVEVFTAQAHAADRAADRAALSILEAHRHCVALGDEARALTLASYGWSVLIDEGKRRSRRGRYHDAARLYTDILQRAEQEGVPLPPKLRGYVRHYAHYNRAKANMEKVQETERGYQASLADWPENALFWSRLVRAQVYAGRGGAALTTLAEAERRVPDHPEKVAVLVGRTVHGLLQPQHDRRFLVEAAFVWVNIALGSLGRQPSPHASSARSDKAGRPISCRCPTAIDSRFCDPTVFKWSDRLSSGSRSW
jgi:tetratricopeptide (TPR) repeat protein